MNPELYGPNNLFTQLEHHFSQNNTDEVTTLAQSCPDDAKEGLFINYVRRSKDGRILDLILSNFSFDVELQSRLPSLATMFDNVAVLEALLNKYHAKSDDLLYLAFGCHAIRIINYLITKEQGFDAKNTKGCYEIIVMAGRKGFSVEAIQLIRLLEEKGTDIFDCLKKEWEGLSWRRLWEAGVQGAQVKFLDLLLEKGADINKTFSPEEKLMPIHMSINENKLNVLEYLVQKKARLEFSKEEMEAGLISPLHNVINVSCLEELDLDFLHQGVKILVEHGADPEVLDEKNTNIEALIQSKTEDHYKNKKPWYNYLNDEEMSEQEAVKLIIDVVQKSIKEGKYCQKKYNEELDW